MPFEHRCRNGTRFYCAELHIGKAEIEMHDAHRDPVKLAADTAQMVGWWVMNIFQQELKGEGFSGFETLRYKLVNYSPRSRTDEAYENYARQAESRYWREPMIPSIPGIPQAMLKPLGTGAMADCYTIDFSEIEMRTFMAALGKSRIQAAAVEDAVLEVLFDSRGHGWGQASRAAIAREIVQAMTVFCGTPGLLQDSLFSVLMNHGLKGDKVTELAKAVGDKLGLKIGDAIGPPGLTRLVRQGPVPAQQVARDAEIIRLVKEEFPPAPRNPETPCVCGVPVFQDKLGSHHAPDCPKNCGLHLSIADQQVYDEAMLTRSTTVPQKMVTVSSDPTVVPAYSQQKNKWIIPSSGMGGRELQAEELSDAVIASLADCNFPGFTGHSVLEVFEEILEKLTVVHDDRQSKSMPNITKAELTVAACAAALAASQRVGKPITAGESAMFAETLADELRFT